jgi:hypothetical protein
MHTVQLLPSVAIRPNLELKTQPKPLLGSLPLVIALPKVIKPNLFINKMDKFGLNISFNDIYYYGM